MTLDLKSEGHSVHSFRFCNFRILLLNILELSRDEPCLKTDLSTHITAVINILEVQQAGAQLSISAVKKNVIAIFWEAGTPRKTCIVSQPNSAPFTSAELPLQGFSQVLHIWKDLQNVGIFL